MTTIAQERAGHERVGYDDLILRGEWGARFGNYGSSRPVEEPADTQHIHISVTNPGNYSSDAAHIRAIEAIGISRFPSTGVSYNRAFTQSGRAYELQPIGRRGAHTVNDFKRAKCITTGCPSRGGSLQAPSWNNNITGRAYVFAANVDDEATDELIDAMARCMAADRLAGFVRKDAGIHGHRCCSSKSCPGNKLWARMGELRKLVDHYLRVGLGGATPTPPEETMSVANVRVGLSQVFKEAATASTSTGRNAALWLRQILVPDVVNAVWSAKIGLGDNRKTLAQSIGTIELTTAAILDQLAEQGVDVDAIRLEVERKVAKLPQIPTSDVLAALASQAPEDDEA